MYVIAANDNKQKGKAEKEVQMGNVWDTDRGDLPALQGGPCIYSCLFQCLYSSQHSPDAPSGFKLLKLLYVGEHNYDIKDVKKPLPNKTKDKLNRFQLSL